METNEREYLCEEAKYLHRCIFRRCPANNIVDAYLRAHAEITDLRATDERQLRTIRIIVALRLDAVGIEPWLRSNRRRHALSSKMLLLAYVAECDAHHPEFMRSFAIGRMALANMGSTNLIAVFRMFRGYVQKVWHGLV